VAKNKKPLQLLEVAWDGFEYPDRPVSPLQRRILGAIKQEGAIGSAVHPSMRDDTPRDRAAFSTEHCKC
jgi:hypothetical protein